MALRYRMVQGTSDPHDFRLLEEGAAFTDGELDGVTIAMEWRTAPDDPPTVDWLDRDAGTVRVTDTEDMAVGLYRFRWKLTDAGGIVSYVPNEDLESNEWRVMRV
jgi:hypothetical protein